MTLSPDAHKAQQIIQYMELSKGLSKKSLSTIAQSNTVGPFLSLLAGIDPSRMHAHFKNAQLDGEKSRKSKAEAKEARKKQRELDHSSPPSKKVKFNPPPKVVTDGQLTEQLQNTKDLSAKQQPTPQLRKAFESLITGATVNEDPQNVVEKAEAPLGEPENVLATGEQSHSSAAKPSMRQNLCHNVVDASENDDACTRVDDKEHLSSGSPDPEKPSTASHEHIWFGQVITRYEIEVGITSGTATIVDPLMGYCVETYKNVGTSKKEAREHDIQQVLESCINLDFETARISLLDTLSKRLGSLSGGIEVPSNLHIADVPQVLNALNNISDKQDSLKIYRAYAQMRFYTLIRQQTTSTAESLSSILEDLAETKVPPSTSLRRTKQRYEAEYYAGSRWYELSTCFGGTAIVLVFSTADISPSEVVGNWNIFQRQCLAYISQYLYTTRRLVEELGDGALEHYCHHGGLMEETMDNIKNLNGYE